MAEASDPAESVWSFPVLDLENELESEEMTDEELEAEANAVMQEGFNDNYAGEPENEERQVERRKDELAKREMELLREEYTKKIDFVNSLVKKLENPFKQFDNELIEITKSIIKKATKKLIHRELSLEPLLITEMVNELIVLVQEKNSTLTVSVSGVDYNRIHSEHYQSSILFVIDNALTEGDIIIRSNVMEIRALIDEGIDRILGEKHD